MWLCCPTKPKHSDWLYLVKTWIRLFDIWLFWIVNVIEFKHIKQYKTTMFTPQSQSNSQSAHHSHYSVQQKCTRKGDQTVKNNPIFPFRTARILSCIKKVYSVMRAGLKGKAPYLISTLNIPMTNKCPESINLAFIIQPDWVSTAMLAANSSVRLYLS